MIIIPCSDWHGTYTLFEMAEAKKNIVLSAGGPDLEDSIKRLLPSTNAPNCSLIERKSVLGKIIACDEERMKEWDHDIRFIDAAQSYAIHNVHLAQIINGYETRALQKIENTMPLSLMQCKLKRITNPSALQSELTSHVCVALELKFFKK